MTTRRTKGEGSIIKLTNGHYKVRIELEPADGKRKWMSATVKTKTEAVAKLKEMQRQKEDTKQLKKLTKTNTVQSYLETYLSVLSVKGASASTIYNTRLCLEKLEKCFRGIPVTIITSTKLLSLIQTWRDAKDSDYTINTYLIRISGFFQWLMNEMVVSSDPTHMLLNPKAKSVAKRNLVVLSAEEHRNLKACMGADFYQQFCKDNKTSMRYRLYPIYLLAYETGMRAGEIAGLKWDKIEFDKCLITVSNNSKNLHDGKGNQDGSLKTTSSYRTIAVSQGTIDVLKEFKDACDAQGYKSVYVFVRHKEASRPCGVDVFSRLFHHYLKMAGIDRHLTFHDIRHTNASLMIAKGVDVGVISQRLGHADISITYKTYAHILQECKDKNMAVVTA